MWARIKRWDWTGYLKLMGNFAAMVVLVTLVEATRVWYYGTPPEPLDAGFAMAIAVYLTLKG